MKITGQINDFEDPLFSSFRRTDSKRTKVAEATQEPEPVRMETANSSRNLAGRRLMLIIAGLAGAAGLTFYLAQSHADIQKLNASVTTSQGQLTAVTSQLRQSEDKIATLQQGLTQSQTEVVQQKKQLGTQASQYRSLHQELKSSQEEHAREISAVNEQKADRSDVDTLKNETGEIKKQVGEANSNISELHAVTSRNTGEIESSKAAIASVREETGTNAKEIAAVKYSLAREVYNFELGEGTGIMKVFNVALSLKDVNVSKQRFNLEILANAQRIRKNGQALNEPIYFYVAGVQKPYEVVITKLDKKHVVGYLSVPKS